MAAKKKIKVGDKEFLFTSVEFEIRKEGFSAYDTEEGVTVRVRFPVSRIWVAYDESGNLRTDESGNPIAFIEWSAPVVLAEKQGNQA